MGMLLHRHFVSDEPVKKTDKFVADESAESVEDAPKKRGRPKKQ